MDDDRDVFLPPKKFRYKQLHHRADPGAADPAERAARLPLKKTAVFRAAQEAALAAAAAAAPAAAHPAASTAPSGSAARPTQVGEGGGGGGLGSDTDRDRLTSEVADL